MSSHNEIVMFEFVLYSSVKKVVTGLMTITLSIVMSA